MIQVENLMRYREGPPPKTNLWMTIMPRVGCLHHSIYMGKSFPYGNRLPYRNRSPRRPTLTRRSYCSTTAPTGLCGNRKPPARNVRGSRWQRGQFDSLRLRLIKIAATIVEKKTRVVKSQPASSPHQSLFRFLIEALAPPRRA